MAKKAVKHVTPTVFGEPLSLPIPMPPGIRPLFLPRLLREAGLQIRQFKTRECEQAHVAFKKWIESIDSGILNAMTETQVEQDFYKILLGSLGFKTQADVEPGQTWSMTPKWRELGANTADATLGVFEWEESTRTISGNPVAIVEVKGAATNLDRKPSNGRSAVQQAWDYLNASETAQWAIVSNYREIRLYSRQRPNRYVFRVELTELRDFIAFSEAYAVFHAAGLLGQPSIALTAARLLQETGETQQSVGDKLYQLYADSRVALIHEIQRIRKVDIDTAIQAAQRLLDRILFIAFAQARDLLGNRQLLKKTAETEIAGLTPWMAFQLLFRAIDVGDERQGIPRYNGNLFKVDAILDDPAFVLDSERWPQVFKSFGGYDYQNEVTVDVLGRIFERSITDIEEIKITSLAAHEATLSLRSKQSKRKAQGVYYTAAFVVEYLIEAALDPLRERHKNRLLQALGLSDPLPDPPPAALSRAMLLWLDTLTLCDPACGSGAFLTEAFNWFEATRCDLLSDLQLAEPDAPECLDERGGPGVLDDWQKRSAPLILMNNLYGVDLSPESVEVAQLSLWIRTARKGQPLTDLSANVVCGNSVVDDPSVDPHHALDWNARFPSIGARGGFDVVVGNPPYVRQERLTAYKSHWSQAFPEFFDSSADLYVYFFGRSLQILRPDGRLAFICSNSFSRSAFGEKLREHLQTKVTLERFLDLGDTHVFKDAKDVYPALIVVEKREPRGEDHVQSLRLRRADDVTQVAKLAKERSTSFALNRLSSAAWQFDDLSVFQLREKLLRGHKTLVEYLDHKILRGIITGLNEAFVVQEEIKQEIERRNPAAATLFKPYRSGEDLRRWYQEESNKWLIFLPNGISATKSGSSDEAEAWAWLRETYPAIAEHLSPFEERARKRDDQGQFWWELRSCDYYEAFDRPKIAYPDIANFTRFSMETNSTYLGNTAYILPVEDYYLLAVLNSPATWFALTGISIQFGERAGKFRYRLYTQYMSQLPVPSPTEKERKALALLAKKVSELSRTRYQLTEQVSHRHESTFKALNATKTSEKLRDWPSLSFKELGVELKKAYKLDRDPWENPTTADVWEKYMTTQSEKHGELSRSIGAAEQEMNRLVYRLFGLTSEEIKLLETEAKS